MARLVISRRRGESIKIGDNVTVTIIEIKENHNVRIVVEAPIAVPVDRQEIWERKQKEKENAARQS